MRRSFSLLDIGSATLLASSVLLLSACGGGGGGEKGNDPIRFSNPNSDSSTTNSLAITEDNAVQLANLVVKLENITFYSGDEEGDGESDTESCPRSGSVTSSVKSTPNSTTGKNDITAKLTPKNCSIDGKLAINGAIEMKGEYYQKLLDMHLSGQLSLNLIGTSQQLAVTSINILATDNSLNTSASFNMTLSGSMLSNTSVKVQSTTNVETIEDANHPYKGVFQITGDKNTVLTLKYDSSGAGVYLGVNGNPSYFMTWKQLEDASLADIK
ncbi:hypothetical protein EUZ85_23610 [Hahella sp. KA22]|uniref:hypothetical protein n=1 Tax=Hahella sp. KA22 TaxID=1628392 RepID=UPI000FDE15C9|nr:hypothetical protein [Hahella sp. KA22]AZZ93547.1 hypothetical protein ENC22_21025 [Hahella sp. KA22]QAY56922.1 hypothetical protein EUZ85_23610 [Hahella sp. KA22]